MEENAKVHISFKDGIIEFCGPEPFVSKQIDSFKDLIYKKLENLDNQGLQTPPKDLNDSAGADTTNSKISDFPEIFDNHDGKISILKKMPGVSKSEKTVNTAIAYLWAKSSLGTNEVPFSEISDACEHQGCLDSGNFAKHIKSAKGLIVVSGSRKAQTAKITLPGKKQALEILRNLE